MASDDPRISTVDTPPVSTRSAFSYSSLTKLPHLVTVKLTHDYYLLWRTQRLPYLRGQRLYGHIDRITPLPTTLLTDNVTPNPSFSSWHQQDQLILSDIISSVSEPLIAEAIGLTTSCSAWSTLESLFATQSQVRQMHLQYHLATLKKNTDSISDYYHKTKLLADTLATVGSLRLF